MILMQVMIIDPAVSATDWKTILVNKVNIACIVRPQKMPIKIQKQKEDGHDKKKILGVYFDSSHIDHFGATICPICRGGNQISDNNQGWSCSPGKFSLRYGA